MTTPDYKLRDALVISSNNGTGKDITLEPGTFIRPIESRYVPQHVKDDYRWRWHKDVDDVFCYCHYGIISVPRKKVVKA